MARKTAQILRYAKTAALAFILGSALGMLGGCVHSDMITEKIYDDEQTSQLDETVAPTLKNSIDAKQTSDELPMLEVNKNSDTKSTTSTTLPIYTDDEDKANTDNAAPNLKYKKNANDMGPAGSSNTTDKKQQEKEEDSDSDDTDDSEDTSDSNDSDKSSDTDTSTNKSKSGSKSKSSSKKKSNKGGGKKKGTGTGKGSSGTGGGTGTNYSSDADEDPEIPDNIDEVAAVGNYAVIVSIVSGTKTSTSLTACDENTYDKMSSILAARGIAQAKTIWENDGDEESDLSSANLTKLINKATPDLVFVGEDDTTVTTKQKKQLNKHNIDVYTLPALTSSKRIRFAVKLVGLILDNGGVDGAEDNYKAYLDWEDSIVDTYTDDDHNGGICGGYNFDTGKDADDTADDTYVTLFIDYWDDDARYDDTNNYLSTKYGVAVSTLGYKAAPISYYMSVGGALNNAAAATFRNQGTTQPGIVWQFARAECNFKFSKWTGLDNATYDIASQVTQAGTYRSALLYYTPTGGVGGYGFGTDNFPAIVAKSKAIRRQFRKAASSEKNIYYSYPTITTSNGQTVGYIYGSKDTAFVEASIGNDGNGSSVASDNNTKVYVNPKGLAQKDASDKLCSWTDGSPESALEASWIYWKFRGGSQDDFESAVENFYSTFYGYDLSSDELAKIEKGVKK